MGRDRIESPPGPRSVSGRHWRPDDCELARTCALRAARIRHDWSVRDGGYE